MNMHDRLQAVLECLLRKAGLVKQKHLMHEIPSFNDRLRAAAMEPIWPRRPNVRKNGRTIS